MVQFNKFYVYNCSISDLKFIFMYFPVTILPLGGFFSTLSKSHVCSDQEKHWP